MEPGEFCPSVYSLEEGSDRWQVILAFGPGTGAWKIKCIYCFFQELALIPLVIYLFPLALSFTICKRDVFIGPQAF
jgi:hypothetical protein